MRKIIVWFLICLFLAIYAKASNLITTPPNGGAQGIVLGQSASGFPLAK